MERFEAAIVNAGDRGGGGALVPVPRAISDALPGKGWKKVRATFNGIPYTGSLMPTGDGGYCLGILKAIRQQAGLGIGDLVTVEIGPDETPRAVQLPMDLAQALKGEKAALAYWEGLSYTRQKEFASWILGAKRESTRASRVTDAVELLRAGKPLS